jgi:thiosulfate dehydrogenase (quinone) large subunit
MGTGTTPRGRALDLRSMRGVPLLGDLPDEDLAELAARSELRHFEDGAVLMRQGDTADALYLIQAGQAAVVVQTRDGHEQVIDHIGPGKPAGELGLLTGGARSATVRAIGSVVALVLPRDAFVAAMERRGFAQHVATELAGRLAARTRARALEDPPLSRLLFGDTRLAPIWLVLRVWLGYQWLAAGIPKLLDPVWMTTGLPLQGYWQFALAMTPRPVIAYDWYRAFIESLVAGGHHVWFAPFVAYTEIIVGIALILGAFTGLAAVGGLLMNVNYLLAGSASTNPVLAVLAVLLILGWKVAGWWGLDHWILPRLVPSLRPKAGLTWPLPARSAPAPS